MRLVSAGSPRRAGSGLRGVAVLLIVCSAVAAGCARPKPPQPPERPQPPEVLPPEPPPPEPQPEPTSPEPPTTPDAPAPEDPPSAPGAPDAGLEGTASWYGPGFHGRKTASGERFDQRAPTAAHRTLELGTRVRVTNVANGRSVIVRINDRTGDTNCVIDLSRAAGEEIGLIRPGTAPVRLEVLDTVAEASRRSAEGPE